MVYQSWNIRVKNNFQEKINIPMLSVFITNTQRFMTRYVFKYFKYYFLKLHNFNPELCTIGSKLKSLNNKISIPLYVQCLISNQTIVSLNKPIEYDVQTRINNTFNLKG